VVETGAVNGAGGRQVVSALPGAAAPEVDRRGGPLPWACMKKVWGGHRPGKNF